MSTVTVRMKRWSPLVIAWALVVPGVTSAQRSSPRFLTVASDSSTTTVEVDPTLVPRLQSRVGFGGGRMPRRLALQQLGRAAGFEFVYANDLIPAEDSVSVPSGALTVLEVIRAVVADAPIDIVLTQTANVVLVRRGLPVPQSFLVVPRPRVASLQPQRLGGLVQTEAHAPVAGATVIVTMGPVRISKSTTSDSAGRFAVRFDSATGDYLVYATAAGYQSVRKRVTVPPSDTGLFVEITFATPASTQLATVTVKAPIERPSLSAVRSVANGAQRRDVDGVNGALAPTSIGNIREAALTVPGTAATPGGVTVLGLPPGQNLTTVDGAPYAGGGVPRAARVNYSVATSIWDPARGGFSGAEIETSIAPATPFETRQAFVSATPSATATRPGAPPGVRDIGSVFAGSFIRSGEVLPDRLHAQVAADVSVSTQPIRSLLSISDIALAEAGIDPVSRRAVLASAATRGIPINSPAASAPQLREGRLLARFDWGGFDYRRSRLLPSAWYVTVLGAANGSANTAADIWRSPSTGSRSINHRTLIKIENNREVGAVARNIASASLSTSSDRDQPFANAPLVAVLTQSAGANTTMLVGGNARAATLRRSTTIEARNLYTWNVGGSPRHRVGLFAWSRLDQSRVGVDGTSPGFFTYRSLVDFSEQRAMSYTRDLRSPSAVASTWNGALALSDAWRAGPYLRVIGGVRIEGNALLSSPQRNPALTSTFGYRNDTRPRSIHVSPRLGVSWTLDHGRGNTEARQFSPLGQFGIPTRSQLRLGVGEFRSLLLPSIALSPARATGLSGAALTLQCTGSAVPPDDWGDWSVGRALPERCVDGAGILADSAPSVSLLSQGYRPPRSWRATAGWTSSIGSKLQYRLDAAWSWQRDQSGTYDLNFGTGVPAYALADEGGRPLFTPVQAVDPQTGVPAPAQARRSSGFGAVDLVQSSRRGLSSAYTVGVGTGTMITSLLRISYTYSAGWLTSNGFDGPTVGDPRVIIRTPLAMPRHMVIVEAGKTLASGKVAISGLARLQSGIRYTPLVSQDINGDGRVNDAAFVFGTPVEIASRLETAPRSAERCLARQAGHVAAIGSCEGPWQVTSNLMASFTPSRRRPSGLRWDSVVLNISNPLGALDYVLHGAASRGWGAWSEPDPVYLQVQGFDPALRRYRYAVNSRFGAPVAGLSALISPVRITLEVNLGLNPHPDLQQLRRAARGYEENGKRVRPTVAEIVRKYRRQMPDPYRDILDDPDSLFISPAQATRLAEAQAAYAARIDSVWTPVAQYILSLDASRLDIHSTERIDGATQGCYRMAQLESKRILSEFLTAGQADVASRGMLAFYLRWTEKSRLRWYLF